ncbi:MAG: suppressor of fused domain protein [Lachnospiraceae bacterium]|nr:suppressor of fused domain protein [Lachnospiraceae bacterium]
MGLFDRFKKKEKKEDLMPLYLYDEKDLNEVDEYISKAFGNFENVFHEIISPDIHLDVCFIPPTNEEPFFKLVTMGAGAYEMDIPDKWKEYRLERAEYVIYVPKEWNLNSPEIADYWPIKVLKDVARLPILCDTWLSFGHTTQDDEEGSPYAPNTKFNSVVLDFCENHQGEVKLETSSGKTINFYQIIPLYPEELEFKMNNDAETLIDLFDKKNIEYKIVDINRRSALD